MLRIQDRVVRVLELVAGRRQLVRVSRFVLNHARRDGPNNIAFNGELMVQRVAVTAAVDTAVVFDVGANVGQWSSSLLHHTRSGLDLHVFEPASACVRRLRTELPTPPFVTVTINQNAVSSQEGDATLFKPHEFAGSSSLHPGTNNDCGILQEPVQTITLDAYTAGHGIEHIDLLKVDTEGHDYLVLVGATELLRRGDIAVVQFEYNHRWIDTRHFLRDVFELVVPLGYRIGKVTSAGIEWYREWSPEVETFIEANYVAARPSAAECFPAIRWWAEVE